MAKISMLGTALTWNALDIANDVTNFDIDITYALDDDTGIDKSAHERLPLLGDTKVTLAGKLNNAANRIHPALSGTQNTPKQMIITPPGGAGTVMTFTGIVGSYKLSRPASGAGNVAATVELSNGTQGAWS